ncbi:MAG: AAA family ATPase [Clostridia bacterium]|nr:AAA family ATPase [Clostridia bacterium]
MQFYRVEGVIADKNRAEENYDRRQLEANTLAIKRRGATFNREYKKKDYYFVSDAAGETVEIGVICREPVDLKKNLASFLRAIKLDVDEIVTEEITLNKIWRLLSRACSDDYIDDDDDVLEHFDLDRIRRLGFGENLLPSMEKEEMFREAERIQSTATIVPELERIFAGKKSNVTGHPVHYMIETDSREARKRMYRTLLAALFANGRICSKRYSFLDVFPGEQVNWSGFDALYKSSAGGAVVVRVAAEANEEDDHAAPARETVQQICKLMKKYQHRVLTVFCFPRACNKLKDLFNEYLCQTSFVELKEEFVAGEAAKTVLKLLAKENKIRPDKALLSLVEDEKTYLSTDLCDLFAVWYGRKLKCSVYPQYRNVVSTQKKVSDAAPRGSAYDELMNMIGLREAKAVIRQALDYHKAQLLFAEKGLRQDHPSLHMVFTGNPGTAKTTVARLFASILKENGLLSKGQLIEAGRGDLVGKYVGWTAPTIQKKFRDAKGGVLFIDEAYSLVDDRDGLYGDEAINTIVQEMENHREDVVVIFAGYPDKMAGFLDKNPGLRSRIAFHVPFADYDTDELCGIADLIAKKSGLVLAEDARAQLSAVFEAARLQPDFGNGRYVRNVIERARMAQATRLVALDPETVRAEDVATIYAQDIEPFAEKTAPQPARRIGFVS